MAFVVVWMVTYNHASYIRQAVESVMMQQTSFDYKLFIGEDCSIDDTRQICLELKNKYPDRIELFLNKKNIGANANGIKMYQSCFETSAKYIALLEGDDYWTDNEKLQKQIDFLEGHSDYAICFHRVAIKYENDVTFIYPDINSDTADTTTIEEISKRNYIHTPSVVYRNILGRVPQWINKIPMGDWPLHILNSTYGKIKFINKEMAVYRVHTGGVFSTNTPDLDKLMLMYHYLSEDTRIKKFPSIAKNFRKIYNYYYAYTYGFEARGKKNKTRLERSKILLKYGTWKMKLFFFIPLIFGSSSFKILNLFQKGKLSFKEKTV